MGDKYDILEYSIRTYLSLDRRPLRNPRTWTAIPKLYFFTGISRSPALPHLTKSQSFDESELQKLPNIVRNVLVERYNADPTRVDELRWVAKIGNRAGGQVRLVRIFDPTLLQVEAPAIRGYDDLDRYPDTILFSGYIDSNNALYLSAQERQSQTIGTQLIGKTEAKKGINRYLVVAHQTATSLNFLDQLQELAEGDTEATFTLLVPATQVVNLMKWEKGDAESIAQRNGEEASEFLRERGLKIERSQVADASPVRAIQSELRSNPGVYTAVILSTLPRSISRWLRLDVPFQIEREFDIQVIHVASQP